MIDREVRDQRRRVPKVGAGPLFEDLRGDRNRLVRLKGGQRVRGGSLRQVPGELPLQKAPERVCGSKGAVRHAHRKQAVRVDGLKADRQARRDRPQHAGQEERRIVVGHYNRRPGGQGLQEPFPGAVPGLDIRIAGHTLPLQARLVVHHSIDHKPVEPVARPPVSRAQRFQHQERQTKRIAVLNRPLKREVPPRAPGSGHPVQHEIGTGSQRGVVGASDADCRCRW